MSRIPRIVIAGTHSGCGKTTIASGIMAALTARGKKVQPFKVGPDFIDPSHHTRICGRPSRNLDSYMMGETGVVQTFCTATEGADVAVIEGVMGMFDGIDGTELASTAHVAKILDAPVILVVDAKGMSRSVHALVRGFRDFDPEVKIAGILFNRIGSPRHRQMIEISQIAPSLGWIPRREDLAVEGRHLGLKMAHETGAMESFGTIIEESCDLDAICFIARSAPDISAMDKNEKPDKIRATIGIALDEAFCFYYQDNFDRIRNAGADIVFFSPLRDRLPAVDGIYLGGGYPELYLPALESSPCTADIQKAALARMPVLGECGGLLYLARNFSTDKTHRMCNVLPATAEMTKRIQALGYVEGSSVDAHGFLPKGLPVWGHEFHYSRVITDSDARFVFSLSRGKGIENGKDGLVSGNTIGSYTHAYFSPESANAFVASAHKFRTV